MLIPTHTLFLVLATLSAAIARPQRHGRPAPASVVTVAPAPVPAPAAPAPAPVPAPAAPVPVGNTAAVTGAESHNVEIINNCGAGRPVFLFSGSGERGPGMVNGPVTGGVAYLAGYKDCQASGVNCGTVEFTLVNPAPGVQYPMQNAINYSLLDGLDKSAGTGLGNHKYKYPMNFEYTGGACNGIRAPGQCLGQSAGACPGAYLGSETEGGKPVMCQGSNAGIRITFC